MTPQRARTTSRISTAKIFSERKHASASASAADGTEEASVASNWCTTATSDAFNEDDKAIAGENESNPKSTPRSTPQTTPVKRPVSTLASPDDWKVSKRPRTPSTYPTRAFKPIPESWSKASAEDILLFELKVAGASWSQIHTAWNEITHLDYQMSSLKGRYQRIKSKLGDLPDGVEGDDEIGKLISFVCLHLFSVPFCFPFQN